MDNLFTRATQKIKGIPESFRNLFKEKEIVSPLPGPTPTPDFFLQKGFTKAGEGYYKEPSKGSATRIN